VRPAPLRLTGGLIPVGGRLRLIGRLGTVPVVLAGDAAGLTHPVTGAGIEAAVRSGELAGAGISSWLGGHPAGLEDYEAEIAALYDGTHVRALRHRRELQCSRGVGRELRASLRRGWIGSTEYWD
jgi:flavin-dependent dehydrogenase